MYTPLHARHRRQHAVGHTAPPRAVAFAVCVCVCVDAHTRAVVPPPVVRVRIAITCLHNIFHLLHTLFRMRSTGLGKYTGRPIGAHSYFLRHLACLYVYACMCARMCIGTHTCAAGWMLMRLARRHIHDVVIEETGCAEFINIGTARSQPSARVSVWWGAHTHYLFGFGHDGIFCVCL